MITNKKTDQAWGTLFARLEADGLLETKKESRSRTFNRVGLRVAVAVVLLCLCGGIAFLYNRKAAKGTDTLLVLSNENKEATLVSTLEDGSTIYLSEAASLRYPKHFPKEKREVFLEGDAFFDIHQNRQSPFFIETEDVRVEVLGTAFSIRNLKDKPFRIAVERGTVCITRKKDARSMQVEAGQTVIVDPDRIRKQANEAHIFFRYKDRLYFKDEKLPDLIRVINQYADGPEICLGKGLEERRLNYAYVDDSSMEVTKVICLALDLRYERKGDEIWILPQ
ncbi:FecR family protein [Parabacteroides sp. Marseille-P3160]|mgnify:CR=1 FL=1|uniref:FecR family protein n=1 Tax=Parabacteroides sp. Marseille-P3160 TaxID=1917887 RepID=UPI0009BA2F35|nr:FecR family protein [Parabacteroides sp. Marseille-P3160]